MYTANDVEREYDAGLELDGIAERYRLSQEVDCGRKIGKRKAYAEICEIVYNHIPKMKAKEVK